MLPMIVRAPMVATTLVYSMSQTKKEEMKEQQVTSVSFVF